MANTSSTSYNATGLSANANHTIRLNTIDTSGNINTTNISDTVLTNYPESVDINESVSDATGASVNVTLEILNETGAVVYNQTGKDHLGHLGP